MTDEEEHLLEEGERYLTHVVNARERLEDALRVILDGGAPDIDALEAGAAVLEDFARGKVAGPRPITDDDVAAAHRLVDLVRAGAPKEEIAAAARRVHEILSPQSPRRIVGGPMSEPLLDAIRARDVDRLAKLLAAGMDPDTPLTGQGLTPLQAAVDELEAFSENEPAGPIDPVVLLLRHGAAVNSWDERRTSTPLLTAVVMNHVEAVRILLAAGADPNVRDNEGYSPLRVCADKGYLESARLLLLCGATKTIDEWGGERAMTALGLAARGLHVEMVKLLLAHGADPQGQDVDRFTPLDCLRFVDSPEDPAIQGRLREIRGLLGAADTENCSTHAPRPSAKP